MLEHCVIDTRTIPCRNSEEATLDLDEDEGDNDEDGDDDDKSHGKPDPAGGPKHKSESHEA